MPRTRKQPETTPKPVALNGPATGEGPWKEEGHPRFVMAWYVPSGAAVTAPPTRPTTGVTAAP
jgi:hypothetical protein